MYRISLRHPCLLFYSVMLNLCCLLEMSGIFPEITLLFEIEFERFNVNVLQH